MTPPCLFGVIAFIFQEKRHEIALAILGQFSSVAEILLGDMHSLCRICGWLASVHSSQFEDVILSSQLIISRFPDVFVFGNDCRPAKSGSPRGRCLRSTVILWDVFFKFDSSGES